MVKTFTDDSIDDVIVKLSEYLHHTLGVDMDDDQLYARFRMFATKVLEPYSNGHRNYN
jgi:hypothetical protein